MFHIESLAGNTRGPVFTESLLRTLHQANPNRLPVTLKFLGTANGVTLAADCPDELRSLLQQELLDAYPTIRTRFATDGATEWTGHPTHLYKLPDVFSIRCHGDFIDESGDRQLAEPIAGLLSALRTGSSGRITSQVSLTIKPATPRRMDAAKRIVKTLARTFPSSWIRRRYVSLVANDRWPIRSVGWCLSWLSRRSNDHQHDGSELATHELFECWLEVHVTAPPECSSHRK